MASVSVHVPGRPEAAYDVLIGRDVLRRLPQVLEQKCSAHEYAVVADHHVADLHAASLMGVLGDAGLKARLFNFPSGEWNKTRGTWAEITDALLAARIGRDAAVIAFGGGVAGDLGGFVAATYLRGVPVVHVATSLLAMIDSSVGGKTGVDVPAGKNLVGAFHAPRAVVADIALLATLPKHQVAAGAAEAIKHGIMLDAAYFEAVAEARPVLSRDLDALERLVRRSVELKADIVRQDEVESGLRQVLNFGHTVGHAIEATCGYELLHGEAIAVGMLVEAAIAEAIGIAGPEVRKELLSAVEDYGLPTTLPDAATTDRLIEAMSADKKVRAREVRFSLPARIGEPARAPDGAWTIGVPAEVTRHALDIAHQPVDSR